MSNDASQNLLPIVLMLDHPKLSSFKIAIINFECQEIFNDKFKTYNIHFNQFNNSFHISLPLNSLLKKIE